MMERAEPVEVVFDVEVVIGDTLLGRVRALYYPAIASSIIFPEDGLRGQAWRRKQCEQMVREMIPTDLLLRLINATPEQFAAVETALGIKAEPKFGLPN